MKMLNLQRVRGGERVTARQVGEELARGLNIVYIPRTRILLFESLKI